MSIRTIGTDPIQVAYSNPKRLKLVVQMLPQSLAAGNANEEIFGKWGSAPSNNLAHNTWDFVLVPGAADGTNLSGLKDASVKKEDLWLIGSTTGLQVNITEEDEKPE